MKTVIFNSAKEKRTSVSGKISLKNLQDKFEEPELLRCRNVNVLALHGIYIHASTFALIYYEDVSLLYSLVLKSAVRTFEDLINNEMNTQSIAQTLQRDDFLPTFIKP